MTKTTVTKAHFETPGFFFPEGVTRDVESRDISMLVPPEGAYSVQFYDITTVGDGGETFVGQPKNRSPRYLVGKRYTVVEIERLGLGDVLARNVEYNSVDGYGILCPAGNWQCVTSGDEWYGETWEWD